MNCVLACLGPCKSCMPCATYRMIVGFKDVEGLVAKIEEARTKFRAGVRGGGMSAPPPSQMMGRGDVVPQPA